ncbi:hypothetical protein HGM15179_000671 [Zosterops borbonicus]|uniref:Uncharacterized protein n=1 Tax=Zosterops borbonicus TaxID=364589 RepID=A0A8K1GZJ5_9PASS|nr:hypothetical protein HGM15179_000671 [Zosterops borbonicus]
MQLTIIAEIQKYILARDNTDIVHIPGNLRGYYMPLIRQVNQINLFMESGQQISRLRKSIDQLRLAHLED